MTLGAVTPAVLPMGIWLLTTRKQLLVCDGFVDHVTTNMKVTKPLASLTQAVSPRGALRKRSSVTTHILQPAGIEEKNRNCTIFYLKTGEGDYIKRLFR